MTKSKKKSISTSNQSSKWIFWVVGLFSVCVLGFIFLGNLPEKEAAIDYEGQPYLGKKSAPVQIVEFGDYKCPVCKNFNKSFFPLIKKEFIDTGKAKFYFMNYSFINVDSIRAAQFAEAVYQKLGNDAFWKFHELLYSKQPEDAKYEKMDIFTESFLEDTLKEVASDEETEKVVRAFQENQSKDAWDKDMSYVKKLGVTGTPTLFINGKKFEGETIEDFKEMVEEAAKENS
ncbi:protein-disulfide isomerase [Anoxybacillus calidus]|jgi:protein-disulfide isomerase|uniref:Protein-disulfide isomerase n=1 Tax=[Anoxybacillus] calidus TaxID=575178 RepID=A0A7V9YZC3_9BACL|nr:thioredoxin domain-containing protein [Anoxybacillus calidus]MBA2871078.1 protein-disulfide isomerase [Anoxybacillus calidus]